MRKTTLLMILAGCGPSIPATPDGAPVPVDGAAGACTGVEARCQGLTYQLCVDGAWRDEAHCAYPEICDEQRGCLPCDPDLGTVCVGDDVHVCNADGTVGGFVTRCQLESCSGGACQDACGQAAMLSSYIGCEYWPVDLDNNVDTFGEPIPVMGSECDIYGSTLSDLAFEVATVDVCAPGSGQGGYGGLCGYGGDCSDIAGASCVPATICILDAQHSPFAVVVSNPDAFETVDVTLENAAGLSVTTQVAPGAVVALFPQAAGFPDQSLDHSGVDAKAYHLVSSRPIVAYQFNPLDNSGVFSNDGSLLIPAHTYGTRYYASSWPTVDRRPYRQDANSFVTVVASSPGTTTVTVIPSAIVRAGAGVPALPPLVPRTFTLERFQTLNLEGGPSQDLTGTIITSDKPVGAFSGHEATTLSDQDPAPCCMDHLEDQLFPASSWGKSYAVARIQARGAPTAERDLVRVLAQKPGTVVSFDPPQGACPVLADGQFCDVWIDADVEITASEPIQVAHYMTSLGGTWAESGDPALAFAVPVEQYREEYNLLVPQEYFYNYFGLIVPAGGSVLLDGVDVTPQLAPFGSGSFAAGRIAVSAGAHRLSCPDGCGIEVYGWSDAVSYLFAGGLDLDRIVVE